MIIYEIKKSKFNISITQLKFKVYQKKEEMKKEFG